LHKLLVTFAGFVGGVNPPVGSGNHQKVLAGIKLPPGFKISLYASSVKQREKILPVILLVLWNSAHMWRQLECDFIQGINSLKSNGIKYSSLSTVHGIEAARLVIVLSLVKLKNGLPQSYESFASGFMQDQTVYGRPADVEVLDDGSILISDDFADAGYLVSYLGVK
jgi:hypothetical protein